MTLTQVWFHDSADLSDYVTVDALEVEDRTVNPGEVRRFAGGRLRYIAAAGSHRELSVTMELVDRDTADQLRDWTGSVLLYRDPLERAFFGVYKEVELSETPTAGVDNVFQVSLTFEQITRTVEV